MYSGRRFVGGVKYKRKKDILSSNFPVCFSLFLLSNFDVFVSGKAGIIRRNFYMFVYALMGNFESSLKFVFLIMLLRVKWSNS